MPKQRRGHRPASLLPELPMCSNPNFTYAGRGARVRTIVFTGLALIAFAANSVLCRLALGKLAIDPASFSTVRLTAAAITLLILSAGLKPSSARMGGTWGSAAMLFLYAIPFSFG